RYISERRKLTQIEKTMKAENIRKISKNREYLTQPALIKDPVEALKSLLTFSTTLAKGARDTVMTRVEALNGKYSNFIFSHVEKEGLTKLFTSGALDREIMEEVYNLNQGRNMGSTKSAEALKIAEGIHKY